MKAILLLTFVLFAGSYCKAQTIISGKVSDKSGQTLPGANVFIKASYDVQVVMLKGYSASRPKRQVTRYWSLA